jgi:hypothetical protein
VDLLREAVGMRCREGEFSGLLFSEEGWDLGGEGGWFWVSGCVEVLLELSVEVTVVGVADVMCGCVLVKR